MGRTLGIDMGDRRIGIAISDELGTVAVALTTLTKERKQSDRIRRLLRLAEQNSVDRFVIGLPLTMDGSEGESAGKIRGFAEHLHERSGLPVELIDERLTTVQAERTLIQLDVAPTRKKKIIDEVAAVLILQSWLDKESSS